MASFNIFMRVGVCVCGYRHSLSSCYILKHWSAQRNRKGNPLIEQEQGGNLSDKSCESACGHFLHVMNSWIVEWTRRKHKEKEEQKRDHCNFPGLIINLTSEPSQSHRWLCGYVRVGKDYNDYKCTGRSFLLVSFKPSNYKQSILFSFSS